MSKVASLVAVLSLVATPLAAQATDSLLPRAGTWGGEMVGLATSGSLLKFTSPHSAWLLGVDFNASHTDGAKAPFQAMQPQSITFINAQLGHRWYATAASVESGHLQTTYGLGLAGRFSRNAFGDQENRVWAAGGYGELGATWFFTRHLSLGAVGIVQALWGENRQVVNIFNGTTEVSGVATTGTWSVNANVARVIAAVYF